MEKRVLITGAAGYLGNIVLKRLHADLQSGQLAALMASDLRELSPEQELAGVDFEQADLRDAGRLLEICKKHRPSHIIHLAAVIDSNSMSRELQYQIDVQGTENLLKAAVASNCQRIIISSSGAAYGYHADHPAWLSETDALRGNEIFPYSDHKRLVEEMLARYRAEQPQLEQLVFRIGTILGASTDNLITRLFHKKKILGLKGHASPFVFVWDEDVAACMQQAVYSHTTGIFNLVGDGALPNAEIARLLGKPYRAFRPTLLKAMLRIAKPLGLSKYGPEQLLFLQYRPVLNNHLLKTEFGFIPQKTSLETFCHYLEHQQITPQHLNQITILFPPQ